MNSFYPDLLSFESQYKFMASAPSLQEIENINKEKIHVLEDGVDPVRYYPFNVKSNSVINSVYMYLQNNNVQIKDSVIVSTKPILLKVEDNVMYVWTAENSEHFTLDSKGYSKLTGFKINDFDGSKVKTDRRHCYLSWHIPNVNIKFLELKGDNNDLTVTGVKFQNDVMINILGNKNRCNFDKILYNSLKVFTTHSLIDFNGSTVSDFVHLTVEGSGEVKGVCSSSSNIEE